MVSVAFTGSRHLPAASVGLVAQAVAAAQALGARVLVGDARGADAAVLRACPSAQVFCAESRAPHHLVGRSIAMVQALGRSGRCVGFAVRPCPVGIAPSRDPRLCFVGSGSGTWATLALAAGSGVPVSVYLAAPAAALPWHWGAWSPCSVFPGAWSLTPLVQGALF